MEGRYRVYHFQRDIPAVFSEYIKSEASPASFPRQKKLKICIFISRE